MKDEAFQDGDDRGRVTCSSCGTTTDWTTPSCPSCGLTLEDERAAKKKAPKRKAAKRKRKAKGVSK